MWATSGKDVRDCIGDTILSKLTSMISLYVIAPLVCATIPAKCQGRWQCLTVELAVAVAVVVASSGTGNGSTSGSVSGMATQVVPP